MTNKEKQYIKELGQLYVQDGYENISCGGGYGFKYKPVDVIQYVEEQEYNDTLNTYMRYRNAQRYTRETTCGGGIYMAEDSHGPYVKNEKGTYINIAEMEGRLKPEDIQKRIDALKQKKEKYNGLPRYSKIIIKDGGYHAYVEDQNGSYVYDTNMNKFVSIFK